MSARISKRQSFPVSPQTYWNKIWLNLPFLQRLYTEQLGFEKIEVISESGDLDGGMSRVLRLQKIIEAPAPVRKVLGDSMMVEQRSEFSAATNTWSFQIVPQRFSDRMKVSGRIIVSPNAQGVEELNEGLMEFSMFGVGSLVEGFMAREEERSQAIRGAFILKYIAEQGLA